MTSNTLYAFAALLCITVRSLKSTFLCFYEYFVENVKNTHEEDRIQCVLFRHSFISIIFAEVDLKHNVLMQLPFPG